MCLSCDNFDTNIWIPNATSGRFGVRILTENISNGHERHCLHLRSFFGIMIIPVVIVMAMAMTIIMCHIKLKLNRIQKIEWKNERTENDRRWKKEKIVRIFLRRIEWSVEWRRFKANDEKKNFSHDNATVCILIIDRQAHSHYSLFFFFAAIHAQNQQIINFECIKRSNKKPQEKNSQNNLQCWGRDTEFFVFFLTKYVNIILCFTFIGKRKVLPLDFMSTPCVAAFVLSQNRGENKQMRGKQQQRHQ